jgi:hypothetical protein
VIDQRVYTFPGIVAIKRYSMKVTFYAADLLVFIKKMEA